MSAPAGTTGRRRGRLPRRLAPFVFGLLLSGMMSCLVSGIATARAVPFDAGFARAWMSAWAFSWAVAFPSVLVVAPVTRRLVDRLVEP